MLKIAPYRLSQWRPFFVAGLWFALLGVCFLPVSAAQETSRKVIARTAPTYPELAKRMHVTGKVKVEVVITASGSVKSARMIGGNPVFEKSALEAVKQWKFESAPSDTTGVVVLEFADQ